MSKSDQTENNNGNFLQTALSLIQEQDFASSLQAQQENLKALLAERRDDSLDKLDRAFRDFNEKYQSYKADLNNNAREKMEATVMELQAQRSLFLQCQGQESTGLSQGYKELEYLNGVPLHHGDVLMAIRQNGLYQHFSIYAGQQQVIHYAAHQGDFGEELSIHQAPFEEFQLDSSEIYILDFPQTCGHPSIRLPKGRGQGWYKKEQEEEFSLFTLLRATFYHLYSPEETLARARSRLGESSYTLPFNNCEHFAIWCKTGVAESYQVNALISKLLK